MEPRWSRQGALQTFARMQTKSAALVDAMEKAPDTWVGGVHEATGAVWVDPFRAFYSCPVQEKVGALGDGGKWVCSKHALLSMPGCTVYSVGSNGDTSFEQAILSETACEVHTFDPTLNDTTADSVRAVPGVHFQGIGLANVDGEQVFKTKSKPVKTLHTIMATLNHTWIDVLKVDIEGHEWPILNGWLEAYDVLPFTQLLIELRPFAHCKDCTTRACVHFMSRRTITATCAAACCTSLPLFRSTVMGTLSGVCDVHIRIPSVAVKLEE